MTLLSFNGGERPTVLGVYLNSFTIIVVSTYISTMSDAVTTIANTAMNADIWNYQHIFPGNVWTAVWAFLNL